MTVYYRFLSRENIVILYYNYNVNFTVSVVDEERAGREHCDAATFHGNVA